MRLKLVIRTAVFLIFCAVSATSYSQSNKFKVTLDAGHGGKDMGACYNGHVEKNISLAVVLKVGKILESTPGFEVNYTRKTDVFIDLIERANIANRVDANIFVSMHCNANRNTAASGTESYVMGTTKNASNLEVAKLENAVITLEKDYKQKYQGYDPKDPASLVSTSIVQEEFIENSITLAGKVQDQFTDRLGKKSRGVKQAPYMVLHKAYMPRTLIEMGFISNPEDGAFLDSDDGQNQLARAIADAIISYKKEYFGNGGAVDEPTIKPSQRIEPAVVSSGPDPDSIIEKPVVKAQEKTVGKTVKPVDKPLQPKPQTPAQTPAAESPSAGNVVFKVQLAVSSSKLDLTPANFNGLANLSVVSAGGLYKYMYGQTGDYDEARRLQAEAKSKGYTQAFVIAFRDGKKIPIQEAIDKR